MSPSPALIFTFSIVAFDPDAREWGVAVESKSLSVGSTVPWAQAELGAIATQANTNIAYGARGLALLRRGHDPKEVIARLVGSDSLAAQRQLAVMDARGRTANYTGADCPAWAGGIAAENVTVQGNMLAGERVLTAMLAAFNKTRGLLGARLVSALEAGQRAGGDKRGQQSAALLVVRAKSDPNGHGDVYTDLRVDDHRAPIAELRRLFELWEKEEYPFLQGNHVNAFLRAKQYARAQRAHRAFSAHAEILARRYAQDAQLHNALAWQLGQNPLGLDAALKYAKRAAKLRPRDENIADTLAEVYYQRGEPERALQIERALVARHPDRADFSRQLQKFEKGARRARRS